MGKTLMRRNSLVAAALAALCMGEIFARHAFHPFFDPARYAWVTKPPTGGRGTRAQKRRQAKQRRIARSRRQKKS